jgi:uncharacterized metal-binding protein
VAIVPCSGIGKSFGSVEREAGYELCDSLRPEATRLVALSKLVLGEETSRALVQQVPTITLDGCKLLCAATLVKLSGGRLAQAVAVLDVYRRNKALKPEGIAELNPAGQRLAEIIAAEISQTVDALRRDEEKGDKDA